MASQGAYTSTDDRKIRWGCSTYSKLPLWELVLLEERPFKSWTAPWSGRHSAVLPRMTMLQDSVRTQAYRNAIETNAADFRDKAKWGH